MAQQGERLNLGQLDPQQLMGAKRSIEGDIQRFAESLNFFNKSAQVYMQANEAMKELTDAKEVASVDQVLVDVGTGYYVEMTTEQGQDYMKRKVDKLKVNMDEITQVLRGKQNQLLLVEKELSTKVAGPPQGQAVR